MLTARWGPAHEVITTHYLPTVAWPLLVARPTQALLKLGQSAGQHGGDGAHRGDVSMVRGLEAASVAALDGGDDLR
jgi:hypothetical protein